MYCSQCGKELEEQERVCVGCGRVIDRYGGFWKRLFAFYLDYTLLQGIGIVVAAGLGIVIRTLYPQGLESEAAAQATQERLMLAFIVVILVFFWLYCATMESQKGATLGKLALGIRVTTLDGGRITFLQATARHFGKLLSLLPFGFGFFMIAITDRKQGLHDMIAKCLVVNK